MVQNMSQVTEFRFLSERPPLHNSESDITVTFKSLCLKGHSYSSEEKAVERYIRLKARRLIRK